MSDIRYDVDGNIVKARFTKPWVDKFSAELFKLGICVPLKLKALIIATGVCIFLAGVLGRLKL